MELTFRQWGPRHAVLANKAALKWASAHVTRPPGMPTMGNGTIVRVDEMGKLILSDSGCTAGPLDV